MELLLVISVLQALLKHLNRIRDFTGNLARKFFIQVLACHILSWGRQWEFGGEDVIRLVALCLCVCVCVLVLIRFRPQLIYFQSVFALFQLSFLNLVYSQLVCHVLMFFILIYLLLGQDKLGQREEQGNEVFQLGPLRCSTGMACYNVRHRR